MENNEMNKSVQQIIDIENRDDRSKQETMRISAGKKQEGEAITRSLTWIQFA